VARAASWAASRPAKSASPFGPVLLFAVAYLFIRWIAARTALQLLGVGLPWDRITEDYDPARGGYLGLGLLVMASSPPLAARFRNPPNLD
jgi:hypothetical protein